METKDDFIICPIKETDNAQMARLIRCVIDGLQGMSEKSNRHPCNGIAFLK